MFKEDIMVVGVPVNGGDGGGHEAKRQRHLSWKRYYGMKH